MTDVSVTNPEPEDLPQIGDDEPVEEVTAEEPDLEETVEEDSEGVEANSDDEPESEEADDGEEIEFEGKTYRVNPELKAAFMRNKDYTQSKQALAEEKRALEADRTQFTEQAKLQTEHLQDIARLTAIDEQLAQYREVDWDRARMEQPEEANAAFQQFTLLRDQRDGVVSSLQQKHAEATQKAQQETAKRLEQARAFAQKEIPDWSPDLESKLVEFSGKHGVSADLVRQAAVTAPGTLKILHLAHLGEQLIEKQRAAAKPKPKEIQPVRQVKGRGRTSTGPRDDQDAEEWLKARNRQLAKKRGVT